MRLGFPSAPHLKCLTSPVSATRRTVLQKVRGRAWPLFAACISFGPVHDCFIRRPSVCSCQSCPCKRARFFDHVCPSLFVFLRRTASSPPLGKRKCRFQTTVITLPLFVNTRFQVLFHSPPGVLFTVPSQYFPLSVTESYLALGGGPPYFPQGSTCLAVLWCPLASFRFRIRGFHLLWQAFPKPFCYLQSCSLRIHNPSGFLPRFGLFRFRSPLLSESIFLSLPRPT